MTPTEWTSSVDPEPMLGVVLPGASDRKRRLFAVACCRRVEDWLVNTYAFDERRDDYHNAVATAERFADGQATARELGEAFGSADDSAFSNEFIEDRDITEFRKAAFGDDTDWPTRFLAYARIGRDDAVDFRAGPTAWLLTDDNAERMPGTIDPFRDVALKDAILVGETISRKILLLVRHYDWEREAEEKAAQAALIRDIFGDPFPPLSFDAAWRTPEVLELAEGIYTDCAFDRMPMLADALEQAGYANPVTLGHCRGPGPHVRGSWVLDQILGKD